jgi:purine-nucleoside phosphorylase
MSSHLEKLEEAKRAVLSRVKSFPRFLVVLGSGLGEVLRDVKIEAEISFGDIPHFRAAGVEGHRGRLVVGELSGVRVACMQGRLHYYEGYPMEEVVFPFRVFALAGAEIFILTNAAGSLHPEIPPAALLLVQDHINLMGTNPLIGQNLTELGPRFPDLTHLYDPKLAAVFRRVAARLNMPLREGVYVAIHGPSYETPAEIRMYRALGGHVVGMSTVPEAITLHHMGKRVAAISCVTNLAAGVGDTPLVHSEVLETAKEIQGRFAALISEALVEINHHDG